MSAAFAPGPQNLITDVPGLAVGNVSSEALGSGVTAVLPDAPAVASAHVMGGAPGTRDVALLAPQQTVDRVDALILSGGSAFGLDAGGGAAEALRRMGRGFPTRAMPVPIVPTAIIYDLDGLTGGWDANPWYAMGGEAIAAAGGSFDIGTAGAGTGASTARLKGGLGSASLTFDGITVGAVVAANPVGCVLAGDGPAFLAAPWEIGGEFGGHPPARAPRAFPPAKHEPGQATAIGVVATDLALTKAEAHRVSVMAHDGIARAVAPAHTAMDGDLMFALSTGRIDRQATMPEVIRIGHAAAVCVTRAIARAVFAATTRPGDLKPTWQDIHGSR